MADNEIDEPLEEISDDILSEEDGSEEINIKLSKPMLIKIAIGLAVVLIGVGAGAGSYFFLASQDEVAELESTSEEMEQDIPTESEQPSDTASENTDLNMPSESEEATIELPEIPANDSEAVITDEEGETVESMSEEALVLQEENLQLKKKISELEAQNNLEEGMSPLKLKAYQDRLNYQRDLSSYPSRPDPKREPTPEPKWGDFDSLNR